jgi:oxygen-independent coproporphyrinogen-3 oxidase
MNKLSLYLHIPFCRSKCGYCDFNSYAGLEGQMGRYVRALRCEVAHWGQTLAWGDWVVSTLYFGGGTPSLLAPDDLGVILSECGVAFALVEGVELTMEANPGTVEATYLAALRGLGVNRLSLGAQSFNEGTLRLLGRGHSVQDTLEAYRAARRVGFQNLNLDLIYGLPGQRVGAWKEDLERALELAPEHLSLYPLTLEEGTPLAEAVAKGQLPPLEPDRAADMYQMAEEVLAAAGYLHYEISNWALDEAYCCQHNLTYWRNHPFLGLGAGAHSYIGGYRLANVAAPLDYIERAHLVGPGAPGSSTSSPFLAWAEPVTPELKLAESIILGLRLAEGVDLAALKSHSGDEPARIYGSEIASLVAQGLLARDGSTIRLTERGRLLGNEVFVRFLP